MCARSVAAAAVDGATGEVFWARLAWTPEVVMGWIRSLPGPAAVTCKSGPTGFGSAQELTAVEMRCEVAVAVASNLQQPAGHLVKSNTRDALHLARLLRMKDVTCVRVSTMAEESARDLTRS